MQRFQSRVTGLGGLPQMTRPMATFNAVLRGREKFNACASKQSFERISICRVTAHRSMGATTQRNNMSARRRSLVSQA